MPCYRNDVLKQEYQGMLICGRQKTFKGSTINIFSSTWAALFGVVDSRGLFNVVCLLQNFVVRYRFVISARYHKSKQLETKHFDDVATFRVPFSQLIFSNFFFSQECEIWQRSNLQPETSSLVFMCREKSQTIWLSLFFKKAVVRALVGWGGGGGGGRYTPL